MDVRPSCLRKFEDTYALSPGPGGTDLEHSFSCRGLFVGLRLPGVRKSFETMLDAIDGILASHLEKKYRGLPPSKPKPKHRGGRSEEYTSELQSLMRNSYAVFCLKKKIRKYTNTNRH